MSKIYIGVFDEHRIAQEGINAMLKESMDIDVVFNASTKNELMKYLNDHLIISLFMQFV